MPLYDHKIAFFYFIYKKRKMNVEFIRIECSKLFINGLMVDRGTPLPHLILLRWEQLQLHLCPAGIVCTHFPSGRGNPFRWPRYSPTPSPLWTDIPPSGLYAYPTIEYQYPLQPPTHILGISLRSESHRVKNHQDSKVLRHIFSFPGRGIIKNKK